ncbi:MAG: hypothetical protein KAT27_10280, partial [Desulfobacterales bacterium]|nr:hypothetical protein [Desulfobacterales bacterium]
MPSPLKRIRGSEACFADLCFVLGIAIFSKSTAHGCLLLSSYQLCLPRGMHRIFNWGAMTYELNSSIFDFL